ncbi:MAG TPA: VC1465 family Xer recombination activation factor [Gallionella sp.]|nr:VC1465 family Xer recombination activation factor [Gallionella sp.]
MKLRKPRRWIDPQDFRDLRRMAMLTRKQAAAALDVTPRTVQNWETGGARIPWMAYRMLRILCGYGLPGQYWDGWTISGDTLYSPNGYRFTSGELQHLTFVFAEARLWRQMYARQGREKPASTVLPFPDRRRQPVEANLPPVAQPKRIGGAV